MVEQAAVNRRVGGSNPSSGARPHEIQTWALRWTIKSPSRDFSFNRCANRALFADIISSTTFEIARRSVRDDSGVNLLDRALRLSRTRERATSLGAIREVDDERSMVAQPITWRTVRLSGRLLLPSAGTWLRLFLALPLLPFIEESARFVIAHVSRFDVDPFLPLIEM